MEEAKKTARDELLRLLTWGSDYRADQHTHPPCAACGCERPVKHHTPMAVVTPEWAVAFVALACAACKDAYILDSAWAAPAWGSE